LADPVIIDTREIQAGEFTFLFGGDTAGEVMG